MTHVLDLNFMGIDHAIASFITETSDGPVLIETGPYSTFREMELALHKSGYKISEIKHVLLTHIHFDHAGAAWAFAEQGATIYLHPFGFPHMENPTKLYNSAKQIYGDEMERLWGEMKPIPDNQLVTVDHGEKLKFGDTEVIGWHTPGHAKHHIAWQVGDCIFTGDVAGVKIAGGPVVPPCPPPDIDLESWNSSLDLLMDKNPQKLFLTHYGEESDVSTHIDDLRVILNDWAFWIKEKWENGLSMEEITSKFSEYTTNQLRQKGVSEHGIKQYEAANPSWMSVAGLIRYWKKRSLK